MLYRVSKCSDDVSRIKPSSIIKSDSEGGQTGVLCDVEDSYLLSTGFLIAADGSARTVAKLMEHSDQEARKKMNPIQRLFAGKPFKVTRYVDDNQRVYKTIPMKLPSSWRPDLNYSTRTKRSLMNLDALPANSEGSYCAVLLLTKGDELAVADCEPAALRSKMDELMPQFSQLIDDDTMEAVAQKGPSYLPSFRYAGPRLHQGYRTVILGDCAHTVKPYFGLGANSALEDVSVSLCIVLFSKVHFP